MFTKTFKFSSFSNPQRLVKMLVRDVCEAVNTPRSLAVWMLFSYEEHLQLVDLECDPLHYTEASSFADDYLVTEFLQKYPGLVLPLNTEEEAMKKFFAFEKQCEDTNRRLSGFPLNSNERISWITHDVTEKFKRLLPRRDQSVLAQIFDGMKWGNGVTSSVKGKHLSLYKKLQGKLEATPDLISCGVHNIVNTIPAWSTYQSGSDSIEAPASVLSTAFHAVPGNKIATVPKNAKTDRTIAVEPHVNAVLQRGIGVYIRRRLLRYGCDLRSQERNKLLAKKGSIDGSLATIDLKGASDTISKELVRLLLPSDWVHLLDVSRSKYYFFEGNWSEYHKWSSMGNGYTFELESAVFLLTALSVCQYLDLPTDEVSIYGDDIIVPTEAVSLLLEVLSYYGFSTNQKKTFVSGPFRESCGSDFFNGVNVRPFFLRRELVDLAGVFTLANSVYNYSALRCGRMAVDRRFLRVRNNIIRFLPTQYRFFVPEGYDGGFQSGFSEATPGIKRRRCEKYHRSEFVTRRLVFDAHRVVKRNPIVTIGSTLWDMESRDSVCQLVNTDKTCYDLKDVGRWTVSTLVLPEWGPEYMVV